MSASAWCARAEGIGPYNRGMSAPAPRPPLGQRLQRLFLTGLLTLLPLWLTWVVVKFVFVLLGDLSKPLVQPSLQGIASRNPMAFGWLVEPWVQGAIALVATVLAILLVGWLARRMIGQHLLH